METSTKTSTYERRNTLPYQRTPEGQAFIQRMRGIYPTCRTSYDTSSHEIYVPIEIYYAKKDTFSFARLASLSNRSSLVTFVDPKAEPSGSLVELHKKHGDSICVDDMGPKLCVSMDHDYGIFYRDVNSDRRFEFNEVDLMKVLTPDEVWKTLQEDPTYASIRNRLAFISQDASETFSALL